MRSRAGVTGIAVGMLACRCVITHAGAQEADSPGVSGPGVSRPGVSAPNVGGQSFKGKTITLIIGFPPGGGYDTTVRLFARYFGRHLPGSPAVIAQNQPGAGSLLAANLLYNSAPKDGTQIALFAASAALEPVMGNPDAKFETGKFVWIGNLNRDAVACGAWAASGVTTWEDAVRRGARFGAAGPAAITSQHALFLKNVLRAPIKVLTGFGGTGPINLAMQRGEVDATCGMFVSSVNGSFRADVEHHRLDIIIQFGRRDEPAFGAAVNLHSLLETAEDRQLADFVFGQSELTRPIAAPPGTPHVVADALRAGFDKTVVDAAFLADAHKLQIDIQPMTGIETAAEFSRFATSPRSLIERVKASILP